MTTSLRGGALSNGLGTDEATFFLSEYFRSLNGKLEIPTNAPSMTKKKKSKKKFPPEHHSHTVVNSFNNKSSRIIFQQSPPTTCTHQTVVCKLLPVSFIAACEQNVDKFLRVVFGVNSTFDNSRIYPRPSTAGRLSFKFEGFCVDNLSTSAEEVVNIAFEVFITLGPACTHWKH